MGGDDDLMDPSKMDGPSISWTVADLTKFHNGVFLSFHVMGSGASYMSLLGSAVGFAALPLTAKFANLTRLQAAGTGALYGGTAGAGLGFTLMTAKVATGDDFDKEGMQRRVDGLSRAVHLLPAGGERRSRLSSHTRPRLAAERVERDAVQQLNGYLGEFNDGRATRLNGDPRARLQPRCRGHAAGGFSFRAQRAP